MFVKLLTLIPVLTLVSCSNLRPQSSFDGLNVLAPVDEAYVNTAALTVSGECRSGTTIAVSGDVLTPPVEASCLNSEFTLVANLTAGQGLKNLTVVQRAGSTTSEPVELSVTLDTAAPAVPTITSPIANAHFNQASQSVSGACETDATVQITGNVLSPPVTETCLGGSYSIGVTFTNNDGAKTFTVRQVDRAGNASSTVSRTITIDTASPANPAFTTPATNNFYVNNVSQTVVGTCEASATVLITGSGVVDIPANPLPLEVTCSAGGTFTRALTLTAGEGTKTVSITQVDRAGNISGTASRNFILDTTSPANPAFTTPATNGQIVTSTNQTVAGTCEASATVGIAGAGVSGTFTATCNSSGIFSRVITLTAGNGTKAVTLSQVDRAGNASGTVSRNFTLLISSGLRAQHQHRQNEFQDLRKEGIDLSSNRSVAITAAIAALVTNMEALSLPPTGIQNLNLFLEKALFDLLPLLIEQSVIEKHLPTEQQIKWLINDEGQLTPLSHYYLHQLLYVVFECEAKEEPSLMEALDPSVLEALRDIALNYGLAYKSEFKSYGSCKL
ncbi:MAG: hypothetical protein M9899_08690 [Bdellovibrionaceae bacterium]|nr:hypothetical protein [Pseudobdellovibrionaceae bacterium]